MNPQLELRQKTLAGADFLSLTEIRPVLSRLLFDANGKPFSVPIGSGITGFELLTAASAAAGSNDMLLSAGTGTEVITRSATGGQNTQSQASTPADGDNIIVSPVASSAMIGLINAKNNLTFRTRVSIGSTALATMFATFGFDENVTDADPTGTAGEGAQFLYDPTVEVTTGLTTAQHLNWILAHKVNGTDTFTATTIPVVAARDYELRIEIGADLKAKFYIDDVLVGTGPALTSGDSVKAKLGAELTATPAGQVDFDTRYVAVIRNIG